MAADHFPIVSRLQPSAVAFRWIDVEVIGPELDHDFVELTLARGGSQERAPGHLFKEKLLLVFEHLPSGRIERLQPSHNSIAAPISDVFRGKLLLDESGSSDAGDPCVVAGTRAKGNPVQN